MKNIISDSLMSAKVCLSLTSITTKKLLTASCLIGLASAAAEYAFASTLQLLFLHLNILNPESAPTFIKDWNPSFWLTVTIVLFVGLARGTIEGAKVFISRYAMQNFATETREKIISVALANASRVSNSVAIRMFSDETQRASSSILNLSSLFSSLTTSLVLAILCFATSPVTFLLGLILLGIFFLPLSLVGKHLSHVGSDLSRHWEKTSRSLSDGIRNNFYLSISGLTRDETTKAHHSLFDYLSAYKKVFLSIALKTGLPAILGSLTICTIASMYFLKTTWADNFSLITFFYLFIRFTQSLSITSALLSDFKINSLSTKYLVDFLNEHTISKNTHAEDGSKLDEHSNVTIQANNLTFAYNENNPLIEQLTFDLNPSECLAIIGESGTGKSTLLSLIAGLLKPLNGEVLINGQHSHLIQSEFSKSIGYVGPHPYFIEGSLRENLLYGYQGSLLPNDEFLIEKLRVVQLGEFLKSTPEGLELSIDEKAERLSAGQKQRIMLARALVRKPRLLILDEPTSNLDEITEKELINELEKIIKNYTSIIVTHRKSLLRLSTKTIELGFN